jgi:hypothetical protein
MNEVDPAMPDARVAGHHVESREGFFGETGRDTHGRLWSQVVVKVIDASSDTVIKELPSAEIQAVLG